MDNAGYPAATSPFGSLHSQRAGVPSGAYPDGQESSSGAVDSGPSAGGTREQQQPQEPVSISATAERLVVAGDEAAATATTAAGAAADLSGVDDVDEMDREGQDGSRGSATSDGGGSSSDTARREAAGTARYTRSATRTGEGESGASFSRSHSASIGVQAAEPDAVPNLSAFRQQPFRAPTHPPPLAPSSLVQPQHPHSHGFSGSTAAGAPLTPPSTPASHSTAHHVPRSPVVGRTRTPSDVTEHSDDDEEHTNDGGEGAGRGVAAGRKGKEREMSLARALSLSGIMEEGKGRTAASARVDARVKDRGRAESQGGHSMVLEPRRERAVGLDKYRTAQAILPSHLPNLSSLLPASPTALPIPQTAIQRDLDASLSALLSEEVFEDLLRNPLGRHNFRAYLKGIGKEEELDLWWDASLCEHIDGMVRAGASAIQAVYLDADDGALDRFVPNAQTQLAQPPDSPFSTLSKSVLRGLYDAHFRMFVKRKLVEHSQVRLGFEGAEREGVGDMFVVTNPRLRDNPIVLVSDAFCKTCGYQAEAIIGRNCRFLQGPGTSPGSVQRIRQALVAGEEHTELLLNYTGAGQPFWNLLCLVPLRARDGSVVYFIGGQIDVTGSIQSSRKLSFLIGGASSTASAEGIPKLNTFEFSPTLVAHRPKLAESLRDFQGGGDEADHEVVATQGRDQAFRPIGGLSTHERQELGGGLPYELSDSQSAQSGQRTSFFGKLKHALGGAQRRDWMDDQLLGGAEKSWQSAGPLQPQLDLFTSTYLRLIVLRPKGQEILYLTKGVLQFLGLPIISSQDLFSCSLLHTDLPSLLELGSREATRKARERVRQAVRASRPVSLVTGLRVLPQSVFSLAGAKGRDGGAAGLRRVALHLTPLSDRDGGVSAYICIVS